MNKTVVIVLLTALAAAGWGCKKGQRVTPEATGASNATNKAALDLPQRLEEALKK